MQYVSFYITCEDNNMRFLRSHILCKLYKTHSDETIDRGRPSIVHTYKKISHTHVKDPVVHVGVGRIMETLK